MCMLPLHAQDMKALFIVMPDSVIPLLTKVNREDCVDFMDSNMKAEVRNRFGRMSEMKKLTADYLLLQTTAQSQMEMKLLPMNDSVKVICVTNTVCGPVCDSSIRFYDAQWNRLEAEDFIRLPEMDAFYLPTDTVADMEAYAALRGKADLNLMKAALSEEKTEVTFTYTAPEYMTEEDRGKLAFYLRKDPLVYEWKDGRFLPALPI